MTPRNTTTALRAASWPRSAAGFDRVTLMHERTTRVSTVRSFSLWRTATAIAPAACADGRAPTTENRGVLCANLQRGVAGTVGERERHSPYRDGTRQTLRPAVRTVNSFSGNVPRFRGEVPRMRRSVHLCQRTHGPVRSPELRYPYGYPHGGSSRRGKRKRARAPARTRSNNAVPAYAPQYPDGAGGRTSFTPASAAESATSGAGPGVSPLSLRMYAIAAA